MGWEHRNFARDPEVHAASCDMMHSDQQNCTEAVDLSINVKLGWGKELRRSRPQKRCQF